MLPLVAAWIDIAVAGPVPFSLIQSRIQETMPARQLMQETTRPSIPWSAYEEAATGVVATGVVSVSGYAHKKAWGVAVIDAAIGDFWAAINDDPHKAAWSDLDYAEVLSGRPCSAPRRVFQFLPVPLLDDRWWILDIRYNDAMARASGGRVREQMWSTNGDWTLPTEASAAWGARGIHINSTRGSWLLTDLDGTHTLVEYYTWADPGGSIPASIANSFADNGIEGSIRTFEKHARARDYGCPRW